MARKTLTEKEKQYLKVWRFMESLWDDPATAKDIDELITRNRKKLFDEMALKKSKKRKTHAHA